MAGSNEKPVLSPVCPYSRTDGGVRGGGRRGEREEGRVGAPNLFAADQGSPPPLHFLYLNSNLKRYNYLV